MSTDPFAGPAVVPSEFASVASFRGRLILIEPTGYEFDVPSMDDPSKKGDRVTATITVVDGSEVTKPVEVFAYGAPTNQTLPGNRFEGVWIGQDRLIKQLRADGERGRSLKMVLGRFETYKPGQRPMKGNPWGILPPKEGDAQIARDFLANRTLAQVAAPADESDPFS